MSSRKINVFDFDGTLVSKNSFHLFLIYLGFFYFCRCRFKNLIYLVLTILARISKRISHLEFKTRINSIGLLLTQAEVQNFFKWLSLFMHDSVVNALKNTSILPDSFSVIATAAPYAYMRYAASVFPVDLVVSFAGPGNSTSDHIDNTGFAKIVNLSSHLGIDVTRINILYTDHIDDLPLALITDNIFLVNPKEGFIDSLVERSLEFSLV